MPRSNPVTRTACTPSSGWRRSVASRISKAYSRSTGGDATWGGLCSLPRNRQAGPQTVPRQMLLVNSKTFPKGSLHPTVEGQRDRGSCMKRCPPMLLEIQWLQLNQQSQCWHGLQGQILAEAQRHREQREKIYRAQALKRCPWIYTRCGHAFRDNKLAAC